jgi:hypothetical protein
MYAKKLRLIRYHERAAAEIVQASYIRGGLLPDKQKLRERGRRKLFPVANGEVFNGMLCNGMHDDACTHRLYLLFQQKGTPPWHHLHVLRNIDIIYKYI